MKISNVSRVVQHCLRHPRSGYRAILESIDTAREQRAADAFAGSFRPTGSNFPSDTGADARFDDADNPLWDYFQANDDGPGIFKWTHYFEIYQRHFAKFVGRPVHVVEVGVYSGGSLGLWRHFFGDRCRVTGVDIEGDCRIYENDHVSIVIGDQGDRRFWDRFRAENPPVDILIDDGGHTPEQQRVTLEEMLPHLNPGGVFLCEDVHGADNPFATYAHRLATRLHSPEMAQLRQLERVLTAPSIPFQQAVHSAHIYPFAVVFERTSHALAGFQCAMHGTQWQPFLNHGDWDPTAIEAARSVTLA